MALNITPRTTLHSCKPCCKPTTRPCRSVVVHASSSHQRSFMPLKLTLSTAAAAMLLLVPSPTFAADPLSSDAADSAPTAPSKVDRSLSASSISFARVDATVTEKLRQRDDNMAWKCKGVNMYDCDGELAEAAEKRFEEIANLFRGDE